MRRVRACRDSAGTGTDSVTDPELDNTTTNTAATIISAAEYANGNSPSITLAVVPVSCENLCRYFLLAPVSFLSCGAVPIFLQSVWPPNRSLPEGFAPECVPGLCSHPTWKAAGEASSGSHVEPTVHHNAPHEGVRCRSR